MKTLLTSLVLLTGVAACNTRADRETGRVDNDHVGVDTTLTTRTMQDTMIVTKDTSVDVDTTVKEGDRPVSKDTVRH